MQHSGNVKNIRHPRGLPYMSCRNPQWNELPNDDDGYIFRRAARTQRFRRICVTNFRFASEREDGRYAARIPTQFHQMTRQSVALAKEAFRRKNSLETKGSRIQTQNLNYVEADLAFPIDEGVGGVESMQEQKWFSGHPHPFF